MSPALLDVNVLLALAWPNHQHHAEARAWFAAHEPEGWATCAYTQLGFVRLSANPAYAPEAVSPGEAAALLQRWVKRPSHRFLNSPPAHDPAIYAHALGHQQVNDAWLVEMARRRGCRLVTLDTRLPVHARGKPLVEVIPT